MRPMSHAALAGSVVGIDIAKDSVQAAVRPGGQQWPAATTAAGLHQLAERLVTLAPRLIVLEATGGYEQPVVAALTAAGLPVSVVEPARVRHFARATGLLAK